MLTMIIQNRHTYTLGPACVDPISEIVNDWMTECKADKRQVVRTRLAIEELLLNLISHYDEEVTLTVQTGKRFGKRVLKIIYPGDSYNPYDTSEDFDNWTNHIMSYTDTIPVWNHNFGKNELSISLPGKGMRTEVRLVIAVVIAVLLGLTKYIILENIISELSSNYLDHIANIFTQLLNTFAVFLIFFSVLSGICALGNSGEFSRFGKAIILRYISFSVLGIAAGTAFLYLFFMLPFGEVQNNSQFKEVFDNILKIVPTDSLSPFINGNMLQIVFMAMLIGVVLISSGNRIPLVKKLIIEISDISIDLIQLICKLLPVYISLTLTLLFWKNGFSVFIKIWKPILAFTVFAYLYLLVILIGTGIKYKVSPLMLFLKMKRAFIIGLTTASSAACFSTVLEINDKQLGIAPEVSKFGIPIGNLISSATTGTSLCVLIYYLSELYNMKINWSWFILLWVLCTIFSMSLPPVSGGTLVCLGVLMATFGIPKEGLALAGTLAIILDFVDTSSRVLTSDLIMLGSADKLDKLDLEKLRSPAK